MLQASTTIRILLTTALILLFPLVAMQFTHEVAWGPLDFAVAGVLLLGTGFTYELVARRGGTMAYRAAVGMALGAALLLIWVNLAVGIIGSEDNPANLMYVGVLAVGLVGAGLARLEPRGMSRALFATALAQGLVPVIVLTTRGYSEPPGPFGLLALNACFVALFVGSALLSRRAASHGSESPPATADTARSGG